MTGRFLRHLQLISVDEFDDATMIRIFTAISDWHFSRGFDAVFTRMGKVSHIAPFGAKHSHIFLLF